MSSLYHSIQFTANYDYWVDIYSKQLKKSGREVQFPNASDRR